MKTAILFIFLLSTLKIFAAYNIYIVDSYNINNFNWTVEINQGIENGLKSEGIEYNLTRDTIDAYKNTFDSEKKRIANKILKDINVKKPDLVICTDDDAFKYVGMKISTIPVIFNGVNDIRPYLIKGVIDSLEKPGHNITGVYQTIYYNKSIELLLTLKPDIKNIAVIGDGTTTSKAIINEFFQDSQNPLKIIDFVDSSNLSDWDKAFTKWNSIADAVFIVAANAIYDGSRLLNVDESHNFIRTHNKLPEITCWAYQVELGTLLSMTDDGLKQGYILAYMASEVLHGKKPGTIPITTPPTGIPAINTSRANELGIDIKTNILQQFTRTGYVYK